MLQKASPPFSWCGEMRGLCKVLYYIGMLGLLTKFAIFGLVAITSAMGAGVAIQSSISPTSTLKSSPSTLGAVDNDPITLCGPGQNSKLYVNVRKSECSSYVDCGLNDGTWKLIKKTECDTLQRRVVSNSVGSSPKVDCTGPDGKHLQITQQECDTFNNAWKNNNHGQNNSGMSCEIVPGQSIRARDQAECDRMRSTFPGYTVKYTPPTFQNTYTPPAPSVNWNSTSFATPDFGPVPTYGPIPDFAAETQAKYDKAIQGLKDSQTMGPRTSDHGCGYRGFAATECW